MEIGQRIRVADPLGGRHYGWIEDIVADMFDGTDLYLVRLKINGANVTRTYKLESLLPSRTK